MSNETTTELTEPSAVLDWQPPLPPTNLIFDDGEPLETNRHRTAMNILIRSLQQAWADRSDFFTGGNMFIYYSSEQVRNRDFRGPDAVNFSRSSPRVRLTKGETTKQPPGLHLRRTKLG